MDHFFWLNKIMKFITSRIFTIIVLLALSFACTKYSEFSKINNKIIIKPIESGIEKVSPVVWRVGPRKKQRVSKGFEIKIKFPQLESDHLNQILTETDVNSWLIILRKKTLTRNQVLGRSFVPLIVPGTKKSRLKQMKYGYLRVYYPAAALSTRYENFTCPAFKHKLKITKIKVQKLAESNTPLKLSPNKRTRVSQVVKRFEYNSEKINGGDLLAGDYQVEIAFYNSGSKIKYSNVFRLSQIAKVIKEERVSIRGCENFVVPNISPRSEGIEQFKFGR
jgi:hypothetical protein